MIPLPEQFIANMREMLGDACPAFLRAMEQPPALALRLNPLRPGAEEALAAYCEGAVPWEPLGRYLKPGARPGATIAHWAGACYVQEASAMAAVAALRPIPGEAILDLCAAPGGKSTQIAAAMAGRGLLVSNDPEPTRAKVLAGNLERMGAGRAIVVNALPDRLARQWPETFDAILVDAPCSGEGMFRRDPEARGEWNPGAPRGCAARQADILDAAARMLKPGGRLVYSTCTFNRPENEGSIAAFLERHPEFAPEDFELTGVGASINGCLRLFPHLLRGDGHFAARLRKAPTEARPRRREGRPRLRDKADPAVTRALDLLRRDVCDPSALLEGMKVTLSGDRLIAAPENAPDLNGIKVVNPGLYLCRVGHSHVEPEHALAMAVDPARARRVLDLDDTRAAAFLAGETLPDPEGRGWTLAAWRGMPLGWGKASEGQLKNHLPKGLRRVTRAGEAEKST